MAKVDWSDVTGLDVFEDPSFQRLRGIMRRLPSNPRCKLCAGPFGGVGGVALRLTGYRPSRKNPNLCRTCFEDAPPGGLTGDIGVLFADVRGFTTLAEMMAPAETAALLNRFYAVATDVLVDHDAIIDKLVGDEVMALFLPPIVGEEHLERMVGAAEALLRGVGVGSPDGAWLPLGVGVAFGEAFVGNVGAGEVKDFTALGDVVNTAARLQALAAPGTIVIAERVYEAVQARYPQAVPQQLELRGRSAPVTAYVVDVSALAAVAA